MKIGYMPLANIALKLEPYVERKRRTINSITLVRKWQQIWPDPNCIATHFKCIVLDFGK